MGRRLAELAELIGGRVQGDPDREIEGINTLERASGAELSFVIPTYRDRVAGSRAGALLVGEELASLEGDLLVAEYPRHALALLMREFHPVEPTPAGVHPTAVIDEGARIDPSAAVGAFVVVGAGSEVGERSVLHAHVVLGRDCTVGADAVLHPRVVLYDRSEVGDRAILHAGVVLGSDGYGFGTRDGEHHKLRHVGRAVVEADVEIGANCTIDRALLAETRIGAGTKIDNLVQVGHNAQIGPGCLLVSQAGVSGSTTLGAGVVMAGQSGVAGHLELGKGSHVAAKSAVFKSVPPGQTVAGIPAIEVSKWRRVQAVVARLDEMWKRLARIDKKLKSEDRGE